MIHDSIVKLHPADKNRTKVSPTVTELPSQQQLSELPRRAVIFLAAEVLALIEGGYRLPEEAPEREFYERCLSSVVNSGRKFAAAEEIDPHEAPGMAAASVISGVKSSSFANDRLQQAAASCAAPLASSPWPLPARKAKGLAARKIQLVTRPKPCNWPSRRPAKRSCRTPKIWHRKSMRPSIACGRPAWDNPANWGARSSLQNTRI